MVRKKNRRSNRKKGGMMTAATRFKKFNNPKSNQIKSTCKSRACIVNTI